MVWLCFKYEEILSSPWYVHFRLKRSPIKSKMGGLEPYYKHFLWQAGPEKSQEGNKLFLITNILRTFTSSSRKMTRNHKTSHIWGSPSSTSLWIRTIAGKQYKLNIISRNFTNDRHGMNFVAIALNYSWIPLTALPNRTFVSGCFLALYGHVWTLPKELQKSCHVKEGDYRAESID